MWNLTPNSTVLSPHLPSSLMPQSLGIHQLFLLWDFPSFFTFQTPGVTYRPFPQAAFLDFSPARVPCHHSYIVIISFVEFISLYLYNSLPLRGHFPTNLLQIRLVIPLLTTLPCLPISLWKKKSFPLPRPITALIGLYLYLYLFLYLLPLPLPFTLYLSACADTQAPPQTSALPLSSHTLLRHSGLAVP